MAEKESPFQVGVEVAVEFRAGPRKDRVAKVYKNGNFTLESDLKQQYRAWGDSAHATGDKFHGWDRPKVRVWTSAHDAQLVAYELKVRWWRAVHALYSNETKAKPTLAQVEAAEALADSFQPVEEGN